MEWEMAEVEIPSVKDFYNPVLRALHDLAGESSRNAIIDEVAQLINQADEQPKELLSSKLISKPAFRKRVGFALTGLKRCGLLANPGHGVWELTEVGNLVETVYPEQVQRVADGVRRQGNLKQQDVQAQEQKLPDVAQATVPSLDKLINPVLSTFHSLGGVGTNDEIKVGVVNLLRLSDEQVQFRFDDGRRKGSQSEVEYRLSLVRRTLKVYGLLENPKPRTWELSEKGQSVSRVNPYAVLLHFQQTAMQEKVKRDSTLFPDLTEVEETFYW